MSKYFRLIIKFFLMIVFVCLSLNSQAQTIDSIAHQVLLRIENLQSKGDKYFPQGLMPTYRGYEKNSNNIKPDNTVFTTGVIVFILKKLRPKLSLPDQIICDSIAQRAYPSFKKYKNLKGRNTYNFWRTDTLNFSPNSGWLNVVMSKKSLPDDMDDTVMLLLALGINDAEANDVHELMQNFVNTKYSTINNTFTEFKYIKAYSTWFGKKMPVDFDICVLSNVLYFTKQHHISFSAADTASVDYITKLLDKKYHISDADYVAPYYPTTSLILYHLSRLMSVAEPIAVLEKYKPQLIIDAKYCYAKATSITEKVILQTALMRWGEKDLQPLIIDGDNLFDVLENNSFIYFIANMASYLKNPYKRLIGNTGLVKFNYYCPAYNDVLFLENLLTSVK